MGHQSYDQLEWYLRRLRYARRAGKLVFVLGSGINAEYGLPDWSDLIVQLTRNCGKLHTPKLDLPASTMKQYIDAVIADPLLQAAAIRGAYASSRDWIRALQRVMPFDPGVMKDRNKPLGRIASIAWEQYKTDPRRHVPILTFNYDDLVERALAVEIGDTGRVVVPVTNAAELARARNRPGIYVYHLHGALSNPDSDIVLDAYTYVQILAAPANSWSWSCMNTFLFQKDASAMFIGLSLLDPSLRLLLTQSARNAMPLSAIYVGKPLRPPRPPVRVRDDGTIEKPREEERTSALAVAWMMHDVQRLFDNLLEELSLIPYHVTSWSEIADLLDRVTHDD